MPRGYISEQRYGVIIFDDPAIIQNGWACISGDNPFYVTSTGDLDTNTIWLTNVDMATLSQKGFSHNTNLRAEDYLRTTLSSLVIELGLRDLTADHQAKVLADLFSTVMQFFCLNTGFTKTPSGMLNNGIRRAFLPEEQPITPEVISAASAALYANTFCEQNYGTGNPEYISLVFHRYKYAKEMLSNEFPVGRWERVSSVVMNESQGFLTEWLKGLKKPALVKVKLECVSEHISHLVNYGSETARRIDSAASESELIMSSEHTWMTSLEYLEMSKYADFKVMDIYTAQGYGYSPVTIPEWGKYSENSYAFGLYCESLWTSLTRALDGRLAKSPLSAWMRSIDRLKCLNKAISLDSCEDVVVHSYGYGRITLYANKSIRSQMPDIATRHKLLSPMATAADERRQRIIPADATHAELMQVAMERGAIDFIERTNIAALDDAIERYENTFIKNTPNKYLAL